MEFYLGSHEPGWIGRSPVPLFISLERRSRFPVRRRIHEPGYALDSGGFTQVTQHGGWKTTAEQYLEMVYDVDDNYPGLRWAAPQDWMCEPAALASTGLTVAEHQRRTVDNFCWLAELDERHLIIPALQGFAPGEHEQCVTLYEQAGVDLSRYLVGVGTICRREGTDEIRDVIVGLAALGLRLHGFGVKMSGLSKYGDLLASADSMAWSFRARKAWFHDGLALGTDCRHQPNRGACTDCYVWAHQWRARVVGSAA